MAPKMTDQKPDHELACDELRELFASLKLTVSISEPFGECRGDWPCIKYTVTINGEAFEYSLGVGHVNWKAAAKHSLNYTLAAIGMRLSEDEWHFANVMAQGKTPKDKKRTAEIAAKIAKAQKKQPDPAEVLASVCREGQDADESFENWCGNFGYEEDSRKAEGIYLACTDNGKKARRILSAANFARFAELSTRL